MSSSGEQLKSIEEIRAGSPNDPLRYYEMEATKILAVTVVGNIRQGNMPPKEILEWYGAYMCELLTFAEKQARDNPENIEENAALLERSVATLSDLFHVCAANKLFVLEEKMKRILKARLLWLPRDFDYTYEGLLPRL